MSLRPSHFRPLVAVAALLLAAACTDAGSPTAVQAPVSGDAKPKAPSPQTLQNAGGSPTLLSCPATDEKRVVVPIDPRVGGVVTIAGTSIAIPAGAIPAADSVSTVDVSVTLPAGNRAEVDARVGSAEHYTFAVPVTITVNYAPCVKGPFDAVSAWNVDLATGALVEDMGGTDDAAAKKLTFTTTHFSGYALATSRASLY